MNKYLLLTGIAILSTACAKHTNEISAQYVSPLQYSSYDCSQIELEMQTVSRRVTEIGGEVDKNASNDSAKMGVGLILLWPTLFFLDGDTPQAAEYGRLKGEFDALEKAAIQKKCSIHIARPVVKKPKEEEKKENYPNKTRRLQ